MALIRDAIRIDGWARAQHATHTAEVRPEWCPLCERDATIYTGYTLARDGRKTWHFTDDRDVLPPDLRGFRELNMRARDAKVQFAIHEIERDGERVCWQVGDDVYFTPDPEPPSPAAPGSRPRYRLTPEGVFPCPTVKTTATLIDSKTDDVTFAANGSAPLPAASCIRSINTPSGRVLSQAAMTTTPTNGSNAANAGTVSAAPPVRRRVPNGSTAIPKARTSAVVTITTPTAKARPGGANRRKRAGTYGQLLDRLEAIGATFCPDCYAYQWPEHTEHLTRGPIVPVAHCTLADPVMVDGLDGQAELVTIQEEEAA